MQLEHKYVATDFLAAFNGAGVETLTIYGDGVANKQERRLVNFKPPKVDSNCYTTAGYMYLCLGEPGDEALGLMR